METMVHRLGFGDVAGWSRFARRLVGRSPAQLPVVPLGFWVRKAVNDVYLGIPVSGAPRDGGRRPGLEKTTKRHETT